MLSIKKVKKLPDAPGVYFFTRGLEILYIGKATSLRDRVRSYFSSSEIEASRGLRITQMLALATGLRYQKTSSVLEALLLESELIKKHQPKYNAREKDDKSYWHAVITKEEYPRILMIRGRALANKNLPLVSAIYGPFPNSSELRETLQLIRKILPYRDKCQPLSGKKCFQAQIGLCPGVCAGLISQATYRRRIAHLKLLLAGRVRSLIAALTREMRRAAQGQDFERGAQLRDQIRSLKHIQDISLIKKSMARGTLATRYHRIESYDIAHLGGSNAVGAMTVAEAGELERNDYRKFKVASAGDDLANLREVLERRFNHRDDWPRPDLVVVDGGMNQLNTAKDVLAKAKFVMPVVSVVKNDRHRPKEILGNVNLTLVDRRLVFLLNHEAHRFALAFHRRRRDVVQ